MSAIKLDVKSWTYRQMRNQKNHEKLKVETISILRPEIWNNKQ